MGIKNCTTKINCILMSICFVLFSWGACAQTIDLDVGEWTSNGVQISDEIFIKRIIFVVKEASLKDKSEEYPANVFLSNGRYLELEVIFEVDGMETKPDIIVTYYRKYLRIALQYNNILVYMNGEMKRDGKKIYIDVLALEEGKDGIKFRMF